MSPDNGATPRATLSVIATLGDLALKRAKKDQYSAALKPGMMTLGLEIDQPVPPKPPQPPHVILTRDGKDVADRPADLTDEDREEAWTEGRTRFGNDNGPANEHEFIAAHHASQSDSTCTTCAGQKQVDGVLEDGSLRAQLQEQWDDEFEGECTPEALDKAMADVREAGDDTIRHDCMTCKGTGIIPSGKAVKDPTKKQTTDARKAFDKYADRGCERDQKAYDKALAEFEAERESWLENAALYADPLRHYGLVAGVAALFGGQKVRVTIEPVETDVFEGFDLLSLLGVSQEQAQLSSGR